MQALGIGAETYIVRIEFVEEQKGVQVRQGRASYRSCQLHTHSVSGRNTLEDFRDLAQASIRNRFEGNFCCGDNGRCHDQQRKKHYKKLENDVESRAGVKSDDECALDSLKSEWKVSVPTFASPKIFALPPSKALRSRANFFDSVRSPNPSLPSLPMTCRHRPYRSHFIPGRIVLVAMQLAIAKW